MAQALLRAENLLFEYDDLLLFDQLNFSAQAGEVIYVEGPNGSGKTTLLKIICGLLDPIEGQVLWRDQPINKAGNDFRENLLYQGHQAGIKGSLSARENLKWLLSLKGIDASGASGMKLIDDALLRSGLAGFEEIPCGHLSAGQKRRVGLARIYLSKDKLWILDEPFTAIDKQGVATLESAIEQHAKQGGVVFITTHQPMNITVPTQRLALGS